MAESRVANSLRNYGMNAVSHVASILLSFIGRTFFIKLLSIEYLGVNGLFSNILSLLSLAELGVGTAITYMMYKPIAENDIRKVAAYNRLFKKIYNFVGIFVLICGLAFTPFIYNVIKEPPSISENLYIIYILFVCNSAISYFFTYKRSLLIAYQKEYVNSQNVVQFAIIKESLLIVLLLLFRDFYVYLAAQILVTFASNLAISIKVNRLFPEVVKATPKRISKDEIGTIVKNTAGMVCHKIGAVAVSGTSNIFISYFVGIATVGIYSNYMLIVKCAQQVIGSGINSLTASFGNLVAIGNLDDILRVFRRIYFINFVIAYVMAIMFYVLVAPFITVWIGSEYLLNITATLVIVVNTLFFNQIRIPYQMVINTYGLFWQIKWKSILEAALSIAFSFFFAAWLKWGITGILMAALLSDVMTSLWWEPFVALKYGMKRPYSFFLKSFAGYFLVLSITIGVLTILFDFTDKIVANAWIQLFIHLLFAALLTLAVIVIVYRKTSEYIYAKNFSRGLIEKMVKNIKIRL